ncbi:hypothetical protein HPB52_000682 [Rhipicephalus sanguineus]|uniref:Reverse transcriptase domain-containing protein n=1 Tax=Rhipicephalus sanguineus TaxID=34632 RepID=A0A9D4PHT1_RHISA|nr:hypothetical protein HPB52_000682 [Rhipicephalus sanguineus]
MGQSFGLGRVRSKGKVLLFVRLDVQSAFNDLPHVVIESALDELGIMGGPQCFHKRLPYQTDPPVLAGLPATLPVDERCPTQCSLYADDVALWVRGPRRNLTAGSLTWIPAAKLTTFEATKVQTAVGKLLNSGQQRTPRLALLLYDAAATAV